MPLDVLIRMNNFRSIVLAAHSLITRPYIIVMLSNDESYQLNGRHSGVIFSQTYLHCIF